MDLLRGNIKTLYFKYLSAAFGSALISSIYGIVDMAMVGQYQALYEELLKARSVKSANSANSAKSENAETISTAKRN